MSIRSLAVGPTIAALVGLVFCSATLAGDKFEFKPLDGNQFNLEGLSLIPVGDPKKDRLPEPKKVYDDLFKGMAKDADTKKLLKKLLASESVEIAVFEKKPDVNYSPEPATAKSATAFGIYPVESRAGNDDYKGCLFFDIQFFGFEVPPTRTWDKKATAQAALWLAVNEYLHRNKLGYHFHHGLLAPGFDGPFESIAQDSLAPAKRGSYIEKGIADYLDKYKK